ncbi:MAG TPA: hypothetical protein VM121_01085 [Acidimicrobiales bacterium]|nr:hypothetical protein [Acidimicrobiales bacterium]
MTTGSRFNQELGKTVEGLQEQFDTAVERSAALRESGASEEVVLAETAVAINAAKALEVLTGVSWDSRLMDKAAGCGQEPAVPGAIMEPPAVEKPRRGWLRK